MGHRLGAYFAKPVWHALRDLRWPDGGVAYLRNDYIGAQSGVAARFDWIWRPAREKEIEHAAQAIDVRECGRVFRPGPFWRYERWCAGDHLAGFSFHAL